MPLNMLESLKKMSSFGFLELFLILSSLGNLDNHEQIFRINLLFMAFQRKLLNWIVHCPLPSSLIEQCNKNKHKTFEKYTMKPFRFIMWKSRNRSSIPTNKQILINFVEICRIYTYIIPENFSGLSWIEVEKIMKT